ncbi:hypothetical protein [Cohnella panacarvi]|uniref:hypothetical protein n=1 Tax=Cohnella panacarvi TaxID=400776 RepID=UPI00047905A3|nr:hypothetical protein [Cohnella panacarvi]
MPMIPNFPSDLLEEHKRWHHEHHDIDINRPPAGYGLAFLNFHRGYIRRVLSWYGRNGYPSNLLEPWASVPEAIRMSPCYNRAAEARILYEPQSFASADELGRFIESSGIHGCIHEQAALLYRNPELNDFDLAPRHTEFYNWHGMIDRWYQNWEGLGRFRDGMAYWCGPFDSADNEVLLYRESDDTWWLGQVQSGDSINRSPVTMLEWSAIGESRAYGRFGDGRPLRVWDVDGDGKLEVVFRDPVDGSWRTGKIKDGRLQWQSIRL